MKPAKRERAIACSPWLRRFVHNVELGRKQLDPKTVHELRIAAERLRVWLALAGYSALVPDLQWFRRQLGSLRDVDVHLERAPPPALERRLRQRRVAKERKLAHLLAHPRLRRTVRILSTLPPAPRTGAHTAVRHLAEVALRRGRQSKRHPRSLARLHRLRSAVRRLRFALEWLHEPDEGLTSELVTLQGKIGGACDAMVALETLARLPRRYANERYVHLLMREQENAAREARRIWRATRAHVAQRCASVTASGHDVSRR